MAEADVGLAWVAEREGFGQEFLGVDLGVEPIGKLGLELLQHDPAGDAREGLAGGGHVRIRVAVGLAVIPFEDEVTLAHHEQAPVVGIGPLGRPGRLLQASQIDAREGAGLRGVLGRPPATLGVGRRKVGGRGQGSAEEKEVEEAHGGRRGRVRARARDRGRAG